jgi:phosphomannomutase
VLGCDLHAISVDPTQPFPREAEPRAEVLTELCDLVRSSGAQIGFAQDPDGDRLAVADETGRVLDNDDVLGLVVDAVLRRRQGPVVVNLTTSSVIDDVATAHGCRVYRTPVGEANVVERMKDVGAVIGGEGSNGGVIFPPVQYCRDSYTGMAFILNRLVETGLTTSQLAAQLPRYYRRAGKVASEHGRLGQLLQAIQARFPEAKADQSDGLKLFLQDGWIHARSSNTEPILRYAVETRSESRAEELMAQVEELVQDV